MNSGYGVNHPFLDQDCSSSVFPVSNSHNLHQAVPITHELFQHQHQFQVFQHQQQLEHESVHVPHPFFPVNFKLGLNESSCKRAGLNHCWETEEHSAMKRPFWKPLSEEISSKTSNENEERGLDWEKDSNCNTLERINEDEKLKDLECKYRLFGELEAIYGLSKIFKTNQTVSGSALTGEISQTNGGLPVPSSFENVGAIGGSVGVDHGSETSIGQEASLKEIRKKKRKRKMKDQLSSMAGFFESLVKQVMEHEEGLHMKFLEGIERMDKKRKEREEEWRCQETEKKKREAIAIANEQAQASSREKIILSYIEKITGQSFNLSAKNNTSLAAMKHDKNCRWPKAEVEALIGARSSLEVKFQETGMKGHLWEEISLLMGKMGYQRNAKRCKEKWENINKYFRKAKESGKKRSEQSKTCPYFDQLNMIYSRNFINGEGSSFVVEDSGEFGVKRQGYVELLEGFTNGRNLGVSEMGNAKLGLDGVGDVNMEVHVEEENDEDEDGDGDGDGDDDDDECEIEN